MSGIEILGIAASVLQIADLGGKLSVKLFTFSRKIKNAHKSIDSISQDIAATGAILQQLGSELKKDEQLRLCSQEAVSTAKNLVEECNKIFLELNSALDGGKSQTQGSRLVLGWKDRLKFSFLEPQVELLRSNLERLKSSLAVMLNVMIFAEQLRNQEALPILKEQRELIKVLVEDKETTQKRFEQVLRTISDAPASEKPPNLVLDTQSTREIPNQTTQSSFMVVSGVHHDRKLVNVEPVLVPPLPVGILRWKEEIEHHSALVKRLLDEASASHHNIDHGQRHRIHEGILHIHWEEWSRLRKMYNNETLLRAFSSRHPVSRFWQAQLEQEVLSSKYEEDDWVEAGVGRLRFVENLPQYTGPPAMRVTADSYVDVVNNPPLLPPSPVHNNVQHTHNVTPPAQQSLVPAPLLSPSNVANRPWTALEIPAPLQPDPEDPDEDSDDGLFSIPLSNKHSTSHTDEEAAKPTQLASADSNANSARPMTFKSPSIHLVPPVPPVNSAHQPIQTLYKNSGISIGAPSRPGLDSGYAHVLYSDEHQLTAEEEEDVAATKEAIKLLKQEDVSSTRNALSITIPPRGIDRDPLSPPHAPSESYGVVGLTPVMNLEASSNRSNLPVSKAGEKTDGMDSKVTPVTLSQVEAAQNAKGSQSAVALFASKSKTTLSERTKYRFEEDSEDDELNDEIDANIEELSEVTGRLNALARAIGGELEVQNQTLESIGMKGDLVDGSNVAEKDVVDDLLLQWTNLSTHELGQTRKDTWVAKLERLRRIH